MRLFRVGWIIGVICLGLPAVARSEEVPSFAKQVRPFLARYCLECHNAKREEGGFNLETYKSMLEGSANGAVLVPGKAKDSQIVAQVEGTSKPTMPPKKARQPKPEEIPLLRAWIDAGARDDSSAVVVTLPDIRPRTVIAAPVAAVAYSPDGKLLVAGGYNQAIIIDPANGDVKGKLSGQNGKVTAVAFNPRGDLLAVASGSAGAAGEIRLYKIEPGSMPSSEAVKRIEAHRDVIYDLAFTPDGKTLASCGYDRLIKLWSVNTGEEIRTLKDHSDAIYSVSFSPDGTLLASGAADRAVKVWDVTTGNRLYTLGESTDWVYSVVWSPMGHTLAAAGVDHSIRIWEATPLGGKVVHSVFAHEGAVRRLAYSADGKSLYSVSEDGGVKAWDAASVVERTVYAKQQDVPLAFAVRPDQKQIAVGRYDGKLLLIDESTGKMQFEPLPPKPKPPALSKVSPQSATRGQAVKLRLEGRYLDDVKEVTTSMPGAVVALMPATDAQVREATLTIPPTVSAGLYTIALKAQAGTSATVPFIIDLYSPVTASEGQDSPRTAPQLKLPVTVIGSIDRAGAVHYCRFDGSAGQEIAVQAVASVPGSKFEPVLQLLDGNGQVLAESENGLLGYKVVTSAALALSIRDREYRGEKTMAYRLHVGDMPMVTGVFPLGIQRGTETEVTVAGVNLGGTRSVKVKAGVDVAIGSRLPIPVAAPGGTPLGNPTVVVGEFPEVGASPKIVTLPIPGTANGCIETPRAADTFQFTAKQGQRLLLEVEAQRIGSSLDSYIEILDAKGQPLPRATLRCLAKTYTVFRDHDSVGSGIRIEAWTELAMRDYLLVGDELMRIRELPKNPDDDCQFYSLNARRQGFLGTTPTHHPQGQPMYKVSMHPPGTTFPPNGLPLVTLFYRNDDGGGSFGKDSRLVFDPPADGLYQVRIGDSRGQGSSHHAYRLTIRPPRPDFSVSLDLPARQVAKGGAAAVNVTVNRMDEFDGPVELHLGNLPAGFSAPATNLQPGESNTTFAIATEPIALVPEKSPPFKLIAKAMIDRHAVVREATSTLPKIVEPGEIVTTTEQDAVAIKPGAEVRLQVKVERRNGFKGRIPLEVRGLPYGIRVLDIGLNGILITEKETTRTIVFYAEPWVEPTDHPFVVSARNESKGTEFPAKSVMLRVVGK